MGIMSTLRVLFAKEWYKAFLVSSMSLWVLVTMANLMASFFRGHLTTFEVFSKYLLELPHFVSKILPVSCLMASLFSINRLKNTNELVAIFSLGVSRSYIFKTIFICTLPISLLQFFNTAFIRPYLFSKRDVLITNPDKFKNIQGRGLKSKTIDSGRVWYKGNNYYASFPIYQKSEKKIFDLNLYYFSTRHKIVRHVHSDLVAFDEIKGQWIGRHVVDIGGINDEKDFFNLRENEEAPIDLLEHPKDFDQIESDISVLNILKLRTYIDKLKHLDVNINEFLVLYLDKYTALFICIIFAFISSVGLFTPNIKGSSFGKSILYVFVFTVFYLMTHSYSLQLGRNSQISPYLACLIVPILSFLFLLALYIRKRKLT